MGKEILNYQERPPFFEINKEDISGRDISFLFEKSVYKFLRKDESLNSSERVELSQTHWSIILNKLTTLNILPETITNIQIQQNWKLYINYEKDWKKDRLTFNLENKENIFIWDIDKIEQKKQNEIKQSIGLLEKSNTILLAMDEVFKQNESEWFWELNNQDVLKTDKYGKELEWMNLKQLQKEYKKYFDTINTFWKNDLPRSIKKDILDHNKRYLTMIMWVWDKYEWWAQYLKEDMKKYDILLGDIVNMSSINQVLYYLKDLHSKLDSNDYQSNSVEKSYKLSTEILHKKILDRLIDENRSDRDFVFFAKTITWRGRNWLDSDIDDLLRDQNTANDALLYIMNRKNWIIDSLKGELKLEDKEISNKNPSNIVKNVKDDFYNKFWKDFELKKVFSGILEKSWYEDILSLDENQKYEDLSFIEKTKLSVLYRVWEKLKQWKDFSTMAIDVWWRFIIMQAAPFNVKKDYMMKEFGWLFNSVALDYRVELTEELEQKFWSDNPFDWDFWNWKTAKELWLTWKKAEAFDLFQDINWNWVFDLSDTSIEFLKNTWKFAWVIIMSAAVPMLILPTMWVVAIWAVAWATATITSMAINPHWYDTVWEAVFDISSDLIIWTVTWALGWLLVEKAWVEYIVHNNGTREILTKTLKEKLWKDIVLNSAKYWEKGFYKNAWLFVSDLTFLWLWPEIWRQMYIDKKYHGEEFLTDDWNNTNPGIKINLTNK